MFDVNRFIDMNIENHEAGEELEQEWRKNSMQRETTPPRSIESSTISRPRFRDHLFRIDPGYFGSSVFPAPCQAWVSVAED